MIKTNIQLLECDTPNQNGRIYPCDEIAKALIKYEQKIQDNTAFGCWFADVLPNGSIDLLGITHIMTRVELCGSNLIGDILLTKTPKGIALLNQINNPDIQFGICCTGRVDTTTMKVSDILIHSFNVFVESRGDKAKQQKTTDEYNYDRAMGIVKP